MTLVFLCFPTTILFSNELIPNRCSN
jgi:hypothetical protein